MILTAFQNISLNARRLKLIVTRVIWVPFLCTSIINLYILYIIRNTLKFWSRLDSDWILKGFSCWISNGHKAQQKSWWAYSFCCWHTYITDWKTPFSFKLFFSLPLNLSFNNIAAPGRLSSKNRTLIKGKMFVLL